MQSRTKKMIPSKGINGINDRLSDLPDHLIVHILSFMPTLYAVKSMLLRRFGKLWTLVPVLEFDFEEYSEVVWPDDKKVTLFEVFSSFARFVRNVLLLHRSPTIDLFHLFFRPFEGRFRDRKLIDDVRMWLRFAIDKQVKDLNFFFDGFDNFALPRCVFTSQSLAKLTVTGCLLEHQPRVHMGTLRELTLGNVKGSNEAFSQLISGCPSLRELEIISPDELHVLNMTSPSVSKLCLYLENLDNSFTLSCPHVKILDIDVHGGNQSYMMIAIDASSLQVVNVKALPSGSSSSVKAFLWQIRNVEVITFSAGAFEGLRWRREIKFPQTRWKRLLLRPFWHVDRIVQVILELVKCSLKLEELVIFNYFSSGELACGSLESSTTCTYAMPLLKKVTIHGSGRFSKAQLQLVELLLGNAVLLEELVINLGKYRLTAVDELNFVKQVSRFRKASTNATVIFA